MRRSWSLSCSSCRALREDTSSRMSHSILVTYVIHVMTLMTPGTAIVNVSDVVSESPASMSLGQTPLEFGDDGVQDVDGHDDLVVLGDVGLERLDERFEVGDLLV